MIEKILTDNEDAVKRAGEELVDIGKKLADGKIDEVMERLKVADAKYREWQELNEAIVDIESVMRDRETMLAIRYVLEELLSVILASVVKGVLADEEKQA